MGNHINNEGTMGKNTKRTFIFSFLFVLVYCGFCAYIQDICIFYAAIYLFYEMFGIIIVGFAVFQWINIKNMCFWETFGISYALGYTFNIILYLLIFPVWGRLGLVVVLYCVSGLAVIYLISTHFWEKIPIPKRGENILILSFLFVLLLLQFFISAANNMSPVVIGFNTYYRDYYYWAGDIVSLFKKFPPENYRNIGTAYHYHYFSSLQAAVVCMCTGIPVNNYAFGFSFIQSSVLLICAVYCFVKTVVHKTPYIIWSMVMILFTTGEEVLTRVSLISHLYTVPFGFDIGTALGMFSMALFVRQIKENQYNWKLMVVMELILFSCIGTKGPVGLIVLFMVGITCVYWVVVPRKRNLASGMIYGLVSLSVFVKLYILILSGPITDTGTTVNSFIKGGGGNSLLLDRPELIAVYTLVSGYPGIIREILFSIFYIIKVHPALFAMFFVAILLMILKPKQTDILNFILFCGFIFGVILTRRFEMVGFSQVYFIMAAIPYGIIFSIKTIENFMNPNLMEKYPCLKKILPIGSTLIIVLGVYFFVRSSYFISPLESGLTKISSVVSGKTEHIKYMVYDSVAPKCKQIDDPKIYGGPNIIITDQKYQAALWLKSYSNNESVITSDLQNDIWFYQYPLGIISERYIWKKDNAVIVDAAQGKENAIKLLSDENVDYLMTFAENKDKILSIMDPQSIVYENKEVIIVKLN